MKQYVYVMCLKGDIDPLMVSFLSVEVSAPDIDTAYDMGHLELFQDAHVGRVLNDYVHPLVNTQC